MPYSQTKLLTRDNVFVTEGAAVHVLRSPGREDWSIEQETVRRDHQYLEIATRTNFFFHSESACEQFAVELVDTYAAAVARSEAYHALVDPDGTRVAEARSRLGIAPEVVGVDVTPYPNALPGQYIYRWVYRFGDWVLKSLDHSANAAITSPLQIAAAVAVSQEFEDIAPQTYFADLDIVCVPFVDGRSPTQAEGIAIRKQINDGGRSYLFGIGDHNIVIDDDDEFHVTGFLVYRGSWRFRTAFPGL